MATTSIITQQIRDGAITVAKINSAATLDLLPKAAASLDLNSQSIINLATPSNSTDAATKGYVDTAVTGLLDYKGVIDCSANPNYPAAEVGDFYVVSVAGKIGGASGVNVTPGDSIICKVANAGGNQAAVGADFNIIEGNLDGAVIGPASATDTAIAIYNGTTGKIIKNSSVTIDGSGNIITNGSLGSTGSRVVKGWFVDLQVTNAISGDITGNAATVTTNANLTGDVTSSGNATTIANNVVTNAKLATVATATFKGRTTAGTGNVEDLSATQATALLNAFAGDTGSGGTKGLVPAPASGDAAASKFLKADGSWATTPAGPAYGDGEIPSGTIDGSNDTFTLANAPSPVASLMLYLNGIIQEAGAGNDFTLSGSTITFLSGAIPQSGSKLKAWYRY